MAKKPTPIAGTPFAVREIDGSPHAFELVPGALYAAQVEALDEGAQLQALLNAPPEAADLDALGPWLERVGKLATTFRHNPHAAAIVRARVEAAMLSHPKKRRKDANARAANALVYWIDRAAEDKRAGNAATAEEWAEAILVRMLFVSEPACVALETHRSKLVTAIKAKLADSRGDERIAALLLASLGVKRSPRSVRTLRSREKKKRRTSTPSG